MPGLLNIKNENILIRGNKVEINDIPFATSAEMDIYVRAADGNDLNPGTSALPLATITAAVAKIPRHVKHTVRIHVGPHTGNGYVQPTVKDKILDANIWIVGDGGGGVTDGFIELVASSVAQAGSGDYVLVTTGGLSTTEFGGFGEYFGATIEILTGAAAGDRRAIHHNTATDIVPNIGFSAAVASGDTYRIVKPETTIYEAYANRPLAENLGDNKRRDYVSPLPKSLCLVNLRFENAASDYYLYGGNSRVRLFGIYSSDNLWLYGRDAIFIAAQELIATDTPPLVGSIVEDMGAVSDSSWNGWNIVIDSTSGSRSLTLVECDFIGCVNAPALRSSSSDKGSKAEIVAGSFWGGAAGYAIRFEQGYRGQIGGYPFIPIWVGSPTVTNNGIHFEEPSGRGYVGTAALIRGTGNGIVVGKRAHVVVYSSVPAYPVEIDVGGIGILTQWGGVVDLWGNTMPTITAGGGDLSENNGLDTTPMADLPLASSLTDITHGKIFRD